MIALRYGSMNSKPSFHMLLPQQPLMMMVVFLNRQLRSSFCKETRNFWAIEIQLAFYVVAELSLKIS